MINVFLPEEQDIHDMNEKCYCHPNIMQIKAGDSIVVHNPLYNKNMANHLFAVHELEPALRLVCEYYSNN